jgi:hypothetical protein
MTKIEQLFARYEQGANSFDPDIVTSEFVDCFMGADPNGVVCIQNNDAFRKAIPQRRAFFQQIGFRSARILGSSSLSPMSCTTTESAQRLSFTFLATMNRRS